MRIACVSDTHNLAGNIVVPECDILIHAGDHTGRGTKEEWDAAMRWMGHQPAELKIAIPGNHDFFVERNERAARDIAVAFGVILLIDQGYTVGGLNVYGSPWQPWFYDWAYNFPRGDDGEAAHSKWAQIPGNTDILITHGPPYSVLDRTFTGDNAGCPRLAMRVAELECLRLHVFGHIHEGYGQVRDNVHPNEALFVNASINDRQYRPVNAPVVVDLVV